MTDSLALCLVESSDRPTVPITPLATAALGEWSARQPEATATWVAATGFKADAGEICLLPDADGALAGVLVGAGAAADMWTLAGLPGALPGRLYRLEAPTETPIEADAATAMTLGWALGAYRFDRYRKGGGATENERCVLCAPSQADLPLADRLARAVYLVRDLINTPAGDMGPEELADAARAVAAAAGAEFHVTAGDALMEGYPLIHAVGRASARAPRLIDFTWGAADAPKVTLVGKGVCFDSGGLDLKGADNMRLMKKDMGGAAHVLGLAQAVMEAGLDIRLRVLVPAVENSVSGTAFRPGDVITSRAGLTVEIGNTDAEGRLVLSDALAEADREAPELIIDVATLTGAARVALGTDLPALFTDDDDLAAALARHSRAVADPLWRMPLWRDYRGELDSKVADINNIGAGRFGGAITAALYLDEFVKQTKSWAHFDIMAWNRTARPGRPEGGEAVGLRALYALLAERHG